MKKLILTLALLCGSAHASPIDDQIDKWTADGALSPHSIYNCDKMAQKVNNIPGKPMYRWLKGGCVNWVDGKQWSQLSLTQKTDMGLWTANCACRSDVVYFDHLNGKLLGYATSEKYEEIK